MNPLDLPILADENIRPEVISFLKENEHNILSISDAGLKGEKDSSILKWAWENNYVILTHDSDFGKLVVVDEKPFIGIIYLRPGHIKVEFTIESLKALKEQFIDVHEKFILVVEHMDKVVKIRIRHLQTSLPPPS